ncbi:MAG: hypothetical protein V7609_2666 [Verrucomicrobiota bacterium]
MISFSNIRFAVLAVALVLFALTTPAISAASDLPSGTAKGSLTFDGGTAALTHAAAFVDQKDTDKPVILILSDKKLASEKWTTGFDMMRDGARFNGIVFYVDKEGKVFRTDVHMKDRQTAVSGIFDVKLDNPASKEVTGSATTKEAQTDKLDVTFHATLK